MKYLAALLLITALQTTQAVPRKKVNNGGQANQTVQQVTGNNPKATPQPSTLENVTKPDVSKENGNPNTSENKKGIVDVVSVPRIDVSKDSADYTLIAANLILTIATLVIALYSIKQANAAKRSADYAERTTRLTERADVLLKDFEVRPDSSSNFIGRDTQFILHIKNFGPTRAENVTFGFWAEIPEVRTTSPKKAQKESSEVSIVLGTGDDKTVVFPRLCEMWGDLVIDRIVDGSYSVHLFGNIKYRDVFGESHVVDCGATWKSGLHTFVADETKLS